MVNHYYFYCVDPQFGPFFIKFCLYFPYNARLCLNGHEYAKRQLLKQNVGFEASDNAILQCDDPAACNASPRVCPRPRSSAASRWLKHLPCPFTTADQRAGFCYRLSMLQAELREPRSSTVRWRAGVF